MRKRRDADAAGDGRGEDRGRYGRYGRDNARYATTRGRGRESGGESRAGRYGRDGESYAQRYGRDNARYADERHARATDRRRVRPSALDGFSEKVSRTPGLAVGLAVACVVLLLVFVARAPGFVGALSRAVEAGAAVSEQQARLDELKGANQQLQQSIDSMQGAIDAYSSKK